MKLRVTTWPAAGLPPPSAFPLYPRTRPLLLDRPIRKRARPVPDWLVELRETDFSNIEARVAAYYQGRRAEDLLPGEREFTLADALPLV